MDGQNFQNEQAGWNGPNQQNQPAASPKKRGTPGWSIVGFVFGTISIALIYCCGVGVLFALIGLITAIVGNIQKKTDVGTVGIVCSAVSLAINFISLLFALAVYNELQHFIDFLPDIGI